MLPRTEQRLKLIKAIESGMLIDDKLDVFLTGRHFGGY